MNRGSIRTRERYPPDIRVLSLVTVEVERRTSQEPTRRWAVLRTREIYPPVINIHGYLFTTVEAHPAPSRTHTRAEDKRERERERENTPLFCWCVSACVRNKNNWEACFYFGVTPTCFSFKNCINFCMARV